jgi:hypothetical protein
MDKDEKPILIRNWRELRAINQESETHILKIEQYSGWIEPKNPKDPNSFEGHYYLSTHTFYGSQYKQSTEILQKCGFNVELENWDAEEE